MKDRKFKMYVPGSGEIAGRLVGVNITKKGGHLFDVTVLLMSHEGSYKDFRTELDVPKDFIQEAIVRLCGQVVDPGQIEQSPEDPWSPSFPRSELPF